MGYDMVSSKCVLKIEGDGRTLTYFVKISNSQGLNEFIEGEQASLRSLASAGMGRVPELVLEGTLGGRRYLVESFVEGERVHGSEGWLDSVYEETKGWMLRLCRNAGPSELTSEDLIGRAAKNVELSSEYFNTGPSVPAMEKLAPHDSVPVSWVHGDFWHGNMLRAPDGSVWLTDFSMSGKNEPPIDVFDLIIDYKPDLLISETAVRPYVSSFIRPGADPRFFAIYSLNRKIALKAQAREHLLQEMLISDLEAEMRSVEEARILDRLLIHLQKNPA